MKLGTVVEIWRYPVKSMGGETVASARVAEGGLAGDRHWAVIDAGEGEIRSAKRWPDLLRYRARFVEGAEPAPDDYAGAVAPVEILAPDGRTLHSLAAERDAILSEWLGRRVRLSRRPPPSERDHYRLAQARTPAAIAAEMALQADEGTPEFTASTPAAMALLGALAEHVTPPGSYADAFPLHLLSRNAVSRLQSLAGLPVDARRFRANLVIDIEPGTMGEESWIGWLLAVGEARLRIDSPTVRCSMPARPQPQFALESLPKLTRALVDHCARQLGVNVLVERPGLIRAGDAVMRVD